jgi:hypothetical protein
MTPFIIYWLLSAGFLFILFTILPLRYAITTSKNFPGSLKKKFRGKNWKGVYDPILLSFVIWILFFVWAWFNREVSFWDFFVSRPLTFSLPVFLSSYYVYLHILSRIDVSAKKAVKEDFNFKRFPDDLSVSLLLLSILIFVISIFVQIYSLNN